MRGKSSANFARPQTVLLSLTILFSRFSTIKLRVKKLKVKTLLTYKSALIDPLKYGFGYDISNDIVLKCLKGMANLHLAEPYRPKQLVP